MLSPRKQGTASSVHKSMDRSSALARPILQNLREVVSTQLAKQQRVKKVIGFNGPTELKLAMMNTAY